MDDQIVEFLEGLWFTKSIEKDYKSLAKILRLLVNHIKTPEGIPTEHQKSIRDKVKALLNELYVMDTDESTQCVSAIDHANKRLDSTSDFGSGLRAKLGDAEKSQIQRKYKRLKLSPSDTQSE
jgi:uncharacterized tellurite resistance protein B-like protein